ncbi:MULTISPECIES: membrane protein YczE [unclassified Pseudonocardia]|uniref:membrane protein YczE n=1 Tax=Pseudonocardia sp. Ae707_Ps2 TaxID=2212992 RepID=UPI00094B07AC
MLLVGLCIFGTGEGLLVLSGLGNSPWTVLAEGLARVTGLSVGIVTNAIGLLVLLLWLPLRQRPGLGTVCNALLLGVFMDITLAVVPPSNSVVINFLLIVLGILLVGLGGGLYLGAALGPGPRDGLMTGLHRVTGRSITQVRWFLEISVLIVGFILGGTVGVGTIMFALLVGPVLGFSVKTLSLVPSSKL